MPLAPMLSAEADAAATCEILDLDVATVARELHARQLAKLTRQKRSLITLYNQHKGEAPIFRSADGESSVKEGVIPTISWHYWGQRLGYECWEDAQFLREFYRDNPACRRKAVSNRTTVRLGTPAHRITGRGRWAA